VSRYLTRVLVLPLVLSTIVLSCKDDSSGPDGGGGQGGEGGYGGYGGSGSAVTSVRGTIGPEGGRLRTTNVSLFVPSGALTKDKAITVTELDAAAIAALPETSDGIKMAGIPAKFEPHGLAFQEPADIILGYNEPTNKSDPLAVLKLDNDQDPTWEYVPGAKFESGSASFQVDGFSIYCVFHDPNGVADMIYGSEQPGSGGTGSGGQGSGGDTSTGGTGGSAGGTGGDPNLPGYLYTPEFHGFGSTEVGSALATIASTDLGTNPGPNCMSGQTGPNEEDTATLFYYVNQGTDETQQGPILVSGAGIRIDIAFQAYRSMKVELRGESGSWCSWWGPEVAGPDFLPWENFDPYSCDYTGEEIPFDPATDEIIGVGVRVNSNYSGTPDFDFCLQELTSGIPNGYMSGPTWKGFGFVNWSGATTVVNDDVSDALAPNCIDGTTDPDPLAYAELGYGLNTDPDHSDLGAVVVGGSGVAIDLTNAPARDLEVHLYTPAAEFCSDPHLAVPSGLLEVPWTEFVDCSTGAAFVPADSPVATLTVRVLSSQVADDPFQLCIESMDEAP